MNQTETYNDLDESHRPDLIPNHELLQVFPEGKKICRDLIKEYSARLSAHEEHRAYIQAQMIEDHPTDLWQREWWEEIMTYVMITHPVSILEERIETLKGILKFDGIKMKEGFGDDIAKAKAYPISEFVKFTSSGFAPCIWHDENTASMKFYKKENKVHCFGCGKHGDVIDVIQQINSCSFAEALNRLN